VPGFLIAGVLVGPSGLGLIANITEVANLAEIGVVLLLFVIGIELKPSRLWLMRRLVFGLGTLQVLLTGVLLGTLSHLIFDLPLRTAILVGPALALSSTAFVLQLLTEQKQLVSGYGRTAFSILLLQDLAVVPLLALVPLLAMPEMSISLEIGLALGESVLILGIVILLGRYLLHPLLHRVAKSGNSEVFTASAVLLVLGTALITEHIGLSMAMGAFLAGLLISDSAYRHQVIIEIQPFRGFLLGLFFMSMGMSLDLGQLIANPGAKLGLVALLVAIKATILFPLTLGFGITKRVSLAVAAILAQSGEFALVLFSLAVQTGVMTPDLFQELILVVLLSMVTTPLLAQLANRLLAVQEEKKVEKAVDMDEAPVVLAGFGRMGHRIGDMLSMAGIPFVALDANASTVEAERKKGHQVFFGDVRNPEILRAAGASSARVIIVTLNDPETTIQIVTSLRRLLPNTAIFARGHNLTECRQLRSAGATAVISETLEASLELASLVLQSSGVPVSKKQEIMNKYREAYNAKLKST
jgi:glutathione-regulated potassium-efflux system protein KefB